MKKYKYAIRFHLARGANYMNFSVEDTTTKQVVFVDPERYSILMSDCFLRNQVGTANKIFAGNKKKPCAWVMCNSFKLSPLQSVTGAKLSFNPRSAPYWTDTTGANIDKTKYPALITSKTSVYVHY